MAYLVQELQSILETRRDGCYGTYLEHLVFRVAGHEVYTTSNVGRVLTLRHELEGESVAAGGNTVRLLVIGPIQGTLLGTGGAIRADSRVPGVASVAVGVTVGDMKPTPVGVKYDLTVALSSTAATRALLPREFGVGLGDLLANLLSEGGGKEAERSERYLLKHVV